MEETQEMQAQSLGWEDPLEEEMATHSRILAWKIQRTEEAGRLQSMGSPRIGHYPVTNICTYPGVESGFNHPGSLAMRKLRLCKTLNSKRRWRPRKASGPGVLHNHPPPTPSNLLSPTRQDSVCWIKAKSPTGKASWYGNRKGGLFPSGLFACNFLPPNVWNDKDEADSIIWSQISHITWHFAVILWNSSWILGCQFKRKPTISKG